MEETIATVGCRVDSLDEGQRNMSLCCQDCMRESVAVFLPHSLVPFLPFSFIHSLTLSLTHTHTHTISLSIPLFLPPFLPPQRVIFIHVHIMLIVCLLMMNQCVCVICFMK